MNLALIGYRLSAIMMSVVLLAACGVTTPTTTPSPPTVSAQPSTPGIPTVQVQPTPANDPEVRPHDPQPQPSSYVLTLDMPIRLPIGGVARTSDGLMLSVENINDSRCPANVSCVWAGEAVVNLTLTQNDQVLGRPTLRLAPGNNPVREADWSDTGYSVSLLAVDPDPRSSTAVPQSDYSILLLLRQAVPQQIPQTGYIPVGPESPNGVIVPRQLAAQYLNVIQGNRPEQGYWQPLPEDIAALDTALPEFLRVAATQRSPDLWQKASSYKRQYVGIIENDQLLIYMNAFCENPGGAEDSWKSIPVIVMDGGDCFFQVVYNIQPGTFDRLMINGDA